VIFFFSKVCAYKQAKERKKKKNSQEFIMMMSTKKSDSTLRKIETKSKELDTKSTQSSKNRSKHRKLHYTISHFFLRGFFRGNLEIQSDQVSSNLTKIKRKGNNFFF